MVQNRRSSNTSTSFRKLDVLDIRDVDIKPHENINFIKKDLLDIDVSSEEKKYDTISSIGCIAHIGLGRYGDKIDPDGYKKGIKTFSDLSKVILQFILMRQLEKKVLNLMHIEYLIQMN